jgi:hypothetical protein
MLEQQYLTNVISFALSALPVLAIALLLLASFVELRQIRRQRRGAALLNVTARAPKR